MLKRNDFLHLVKNNISKPFDDFAARVWRDEIKDTNIKTAVQFLQIGFALILANHNGDDMQEPETIGTKEEFENNDMFVENPWDISLSVMKVESGDHSDLAAAKDIYNYFVTEIMPQDQANAETAQMGAMARAFGGACLKKAEELVADDDDASIKLGLRVAAFSKTNRISVEDYPWDHALERFASCKNVYERFKKGTLAEIRQDGYRIGSKEHNETLALLQKLRNGPKVS